jgi:hypothetical protein
MEERIGRGLLVHLSGRTWGKFSEPVISLAELIPKYINAYLKTEKDIFKIIIIIITAYHLNFKQFSPVQVLY